jgi:hypothetical protein
MGEKSRRETWDAIEWKHFGQCMWQQRTPDGKRLLEGRLHKATGRIFVVEKFYEHKLPSPHTSKPWPELETVNVYAPVDAEGVTWEGLDVALASSEGSKPPDHRLFRETEAAFGVRERPRPIGNSRRGTMKNA